MAAYMHRSLVALGCRICRQGSLLMLPVTASQGQQRICNYSSVPCDLTDLPEQDCRKPTADTLTPSKVVELLDRHIVGQEEAKRAVAVALRNRWRRHRIKSPMKEEIVPKNILMIGPTGCGKTEIARRLAKLADAPFVKVEATKFTEVGFHGRDVDQIIRDLVDAAIQLQKQKVRVKVKEEVREAVEKKLLDLLVGQEHASEEYVAPKVRTRTREEFKKSLDNGLLDDRRITLDIPDSRVRLPIDSPAGSVSLNEIIGKMFRGKAEKRELTIGEAIPLLGEIEMEKYLNSDQITKDAILLAESDGIVFIDEIDKIVTNSDTRHGADASSEGVQRDLLPIIEGSTVNTRYGNVNTDHILFICSGAFHSCKPSDMLAELQGRLPIRVELKGLTREDLYRVLTEPEMNMIKQQECLMETENIRLIFTDEAILELAAVAAEVNRSLDNIGARRLHTVIERVVEDISFHAPERAGQEWVIDKEYVRRAVGDLLHKMDLSKFVL
ncbi:hypothetical protein CBR_g30649 [Chara braunii]|uniref:AAA+ ATPase domain-containing protein n=1 Tax=Chara braunii TaxID=69332 RepID=A0A388LDJ3_CHABU|nr:hypothetical protein CBR_g30649 [Chara braunii]|eukprot:GBG80282.1 hypothetical protein CBR_g30649 [Chara braunii]